MTKSVDKVYKVIQEEYGDEWTDTKTIANVAGLSRNVISIYLSQLYKEGNWSKKMVDQYYGKLLRMMFLFKI
ncbi:hypothetical protein [Companilactobacillus paralimentarius]|uniref:hypothetical protein n=1 Tax=Companilactobacillus paralimentarius TaxID=83526 RepID=UPI001265F75D|nr:hypothetical protein [Companilactobacillus paralimentarius]QFR69543.1 hypothetical protein LP238_06840 [Companilactobacillus paralimentarius]